MIETTIDSLLLIIGRQQVEIEMLRRQVIQLEQAVRQAAIGEPGDKAKKESDGVPALAAN